MWQVGGRKNLQILTWALKKGLTYAVLLCSAFKTDKGEEPNRQYTDRYKETNKRNDAL